MKENLSERCISCQNAEHAYAENPYTQQCHYFALRCKIGEDGKDDCVKWEKWDKVIEFELERKGW